MSDEIRNARKLLITPGAHRQVSAELSAAFDAHRDAVIANYAHLVTAQIERCELTRQQQLAMPGKGREARAAAAARAEWLAGSQPAETTGEQPAKMGCTTSGDSTAAHAHLTPTPARTASGASNPTSRLGSQSRAGRRSCEKRASIVRESRLYSTCR